LRFMHILVDVAVVIVAGLHLGFLILEMFLWTKPFGMRTFRLSPEIAQASAGLAANQGLYNGFLAAGLLWSLWRGDFPTTLFFLSCVIVAGIFGGFTAKRSILWIQAFPALLALLAVIASHRG
jgi:putative membrane protein